MTRTTPSIVLVTDVAYWQLSRGNEVRISALIEFLAQHYRVNVAYVGVRPMPADSGSVRHFRLPSASGLKRIPKEVVDRLPEELRLRLISLLNRKNYTRTPTDFRNRATVAAFSRLVDQLRPDAIIVEYIWYAFVLDGTQATSVPRIIDTHDLMHRRCACFATYGQIPDRSVGEVEELEILRRFDAVLAIQHTEASILRRRMENDILLAPHPQVPRQGFYERRLSTVGPSDPLQLVYIGSHSDMNVDAIRWFLDEVWDADMVREFRLLVFGSVCHLLGQPSAGIEFCNRTPTLDQAYGQADIAINPVRFGSGLKIKNIEALAFGVPLMTSETGAEGLPQGAEHGLMVARNAEEFRGALQRLKDRDLRAALSRGGLHTIVARRARRGQTQNAGLCSLRQTVRSEKHHHQGALRGGHGRRSGHVAPADRRQLHRVVGTPRGCPRRRAGRRPR